MNEIKVHMYETGRLSMPAQFRKEMGIKEADFVASYEDGAITFRLLKDVREAARRRLASQIRPEVSLVEELFAMRREEVAKEDAEYEEYLKRNAKHD
jgi:bifunctional DNA-binding transcriptional regulator/antitoxin component of YhaV-PrlF toxin-antitoxin module